MAGSQEDAAIGLVLSNDVASGRSGEYAVFTNDEPLDTIRSTDLDDFMDGRLRKVSTISTYNNSLSLWRDSIEDRLYKVFGVMLRRL